MLAELPNGEHFVIWSTRWPRSCPKALVGSVQKMSPPLLAMLRGEGLSFGECLRSPTTPARNRDMDGKGCSDFFLEVNERMLDRIAGLEKIIVPELVERRANSYPLRKLLRSVC